MAHYVRSRFDLDCQILPFSSKDIVRIEIVGSVCNAGLEGINEFLILFLIDPTATRLTLNEVAQINDLLDIVDNMQGNK